MADGEVKRKDRDESGKFVKGHKVPSPHKGRPARGDVMPVLTAITEAAYTAEELVAMIHDTYEMAVKNEDWKGMYAVISFVVAYAVGKPVQRSLTAQVDPEQIRQLLRGGVNDERQAVDENESGGQDGDATGRRLESDISGEYRIDGRISGTEVQPVGTTSEGEVRGGLGESGGVGGE